MPIVDLLINEIKFKTLFTTILNEFSSAWMDFQWFPSKFHLTTTPLAFLHRPTTTPARFPTSRAPPSRPQTSSIPWPIISRTPGVTSRWQASLLLTCPWPWRRWQAVITWSCTRAEEQSTLEICPNSVRIWSPYMGLLKWALKLAACQLRMVILCCTNNPTTWVCSFYSVECKWLNDWLSLFEVYIHFLMFNFDDCFLRTCTQLWSCITRSFVQFC